MQLQGVRALEASITNHPSSSSQNLSPMAARDRALGGKPERDHLAAAREMRDMDLEGPHDREGNEIPRMGMCRTRPPGCEGRAFERAAAHGADHAHADAKVLKARSALVDNLQARTGAPCASGTTERGITRSHSELGS